MDSLAAQYVGQMSARSSPADASTAAGITAVHKLAVCYHAQNNCEQAESLYRKALAAMDTPERRNDPEFGQLLNNLARLYCSQGKHKEAEPLLRQSLEVAERHYGPKSQKVAKRLANLAEVYGAMGRYDDAFASYQQAIAILERILGPAHPSTVKYANARTAMLAQSAKQSSSTSLGR